MKIEEYELGQKVSLYGVIEEINIEDIYDKENTTTLSIKTVTGKIHVNPKWEEVKLDQPKLVVPKFVAEWLKYCKNNEISLYDAMTDGDDELDKWFAVDELNRQELFAEAWLAYPNITVEKEKLYTVKIPNPNGCNLYLIKVANKEVTITSDILADVFPDNLKLTEQEIRKDYDWAFRWAKEVTE